MMSDTDRATATIRPGGMIRALLTISTVTLVAVAGYGGFRFAARLDLGTEAGAGLVALAVITGFAVFFSPCSFPLVVTMLAGPNRAAKAAQRRRESLTAAVAMGAGASLFLLAVGIIVGVTGEALVQSVGFSTTPGRVLRGTVATVIVAAGLIQLGVLQFPFWRVTRFAQPIERHRVKLSGQHQHAAQVFYGFGFVLAGFGWTGPLLASLASQATITGGITNGIVAFSIAATTLVLTLVTASLTLASISDHRLAEVRTQGPQMKRIGGAVLLVVGTWFAYLAITNPTYLLP